MGISPLAQQIEAINLARNSHYYIYQSTESTDGNDVLWF